jgi:histone-lysine N-methyltransferase SETD2
LGARVACKLKLYFDLCRFVRFGPEVKCYCGAPNCQGYLGTKRKIAKLNIGWGAKRKRTSTACVAIITM